MPPMRVRMRSSCAVRMKIEVREWRRRKYGGMFVECGMGSIAVDERTNGVENALATVASQLTGLALAHIRSVEVPDKLATGVICIHLAATRLAGKNVFSSPAVYQRSQ